MAALSAPVAGLQVPAAQGMGAFAPGGQKEPAAHAVQPRAPLTAYWPAAQQTPAPAPLKMPAAQGAQAATLVLPVCTKLVLAGQSMQRPEERPP